MLKHFQALEQLTARFVEGIDSATYEEVEEYMRQRHVLFAYLQRQKLSPELREQYRPYAERILTMQPAIQERVDKLKDQAMAQLSKVHSGKKQQAYYQDSDVDSMFFDKKR